MSKKSIHNRKKEKSTVAEINFICTTFILTSSQPRGFPFVPFFLLIPSIFEIINELINISGTESPT